MITNKLTKTDLQTKDFYYDLPEDRIAQTPLEKRDSSKLLVLDKNSGETEHKIFSDVAQYIRPEDVLVLNDSKVIPARLYGKKSDTGIDIEILLLRQHELDTWEVLTRPGRRAKPGTTILFDNGKLRAEILDTLEGGNRLCKFTYDGFSNFFEAIDVIGNMPLPPYITKKLEDKSRYQTVYANVEGSAAAPTAGLHFTNELLNKIEESGTAIAKVMLHVGLGTFRPVKVDKLSEHVMHSEFFSITPETAKLINERKNSGGRIICVGTTSCRVIESVADDDGIIHPHTEDTGIFIYPGYKFKAVDALITNFHLPESTLLMLVSALSRREYIMNAYKEAIEKDYRFFSFGDAMFIH